MQTYRVALAGCGPRGRDHLHGFHQNNARFEVAGVCDLDRSRAESAARDYGVEAVYDDAPAMLAKTKPDVFCFATMPDVRLPLVELGIEHGVKAIALEKPLALSLAEARAIRDACVTAGVKWIVSHQQKYGPHYQAVKGIASSGRIGEVQTIRATSQAWLMQLGTHLVDYAMWMNEGGRPAQVLGQAMGAERLSDSHPSPDHVFGHILFDNGVRAMVEFGPYAPSFLPADQFWVDDSLTCYGTHGYAGLVLGGGWRAVTKDSEGAVVKGEGVFDPSYEQPLYIRDLAGWLDDDAQVHPCDGAVSYAGFEACMALCWSALERRPVDLPLDKLPDEPLLERMRRKLGPV